MGNALTHDAVFAVFLRLTDKLVKVLTLKIPGELC